MRILGSVASSHSCWTMCADGRTFSETLIGHKAYRDSGKIGSGYELGADHWPRAFFSYSHDDEEHRNQLEKHLALLRHQGLMRLGTIGAFLQARRSMMPLTTTSIAQMSFSCLLAQVSSRRRTAIPVK
jgi:hypothetical protein